MKNNQSIWKHRFLRNNTRFVFFVVLSLVLSVLPFSTASISVTKPLVPCSYLTSAQKSGWEPQESGVSQNLNSIFLICINRGSIAGDEGVILRTGDGGNNWTTQNSGVTDNLYDIFYYDYSIILAVGASGTILYTNNSGGNWTIIQTGMTGTYFSGRMITDTIGVAVGVNAIFQPFFTRTNDGWNTWESTSFYIENNSTLYEGWLSDVYFINDSIGFATAVVNIPAGGAIVRTTDGGSTWDTMYFSNEELLGIDFTEEGIGYAVGNHGVILQTLDGGDTWNSLDSGVNTTLHAIDFSSEARGTAVGNNGIIIRTQNAGSTWTQQTSGTNNDLLAVRFITEQLGFVVGEHGVILHTTTGGFPDDTFPPETNCTLTGIKEGEIYINNVTVTFSATDDISGVSSTVFKLDDGLWTTYTDPFLISTERNHILYFYSIDNAGNAEEEKTCEFTIQYPPDINVTITGGFGISATIKNLGSSDLTNASWNLSFEGGIILFGKQKSGITTIKAGNEVTLTYLVFGFGKTTITLTITSSKTTKHARIFLFFVHI
jgi:photosystem II stability/assembly factor-like uncharacterized protein